MRNVFTTHASIAAMMPRTRSATVPPEELPVRVSDTPPCATAFAYCRSEDRGSLPTLTLKSRNCLRSSIGACAPYSSTTGMLTSSTKITTYYKTGGKTLNAVEVRERDSFRSSTLGMLGAYVWQGRGRQVLRESLQGVVVHDDPRGARAAVGRAFASLLTFSARFLYTLCRRRIDYRRDEGIPTIAAHEPTLWSGSGKHASHKIPVPVGLPGRISRACECASL